MSRNPRVRRPHRAGRGGWGAISPAAPQTLQTPLPRLWRGFVGREVHEFTALLVAALEDPGAVGLGLDEVGLPAALRTGHVHRRIIYKPAGCRAKFLADDGQGFGGPEDSADSGDGGGGGGGGGRGLESMTSRGRSPGAKSPVWSCPRSPSFRRRLRSFFISRFRRFRASRIRFPEVSAIGPPFYRSTR